MNNKSFVEANIISDRFEKEVLIKELKNKKNKQLFKWSGGYHPEFDIKIISDDNTENKIEVKTQSIYNNKDDYFVIESIQKGMLSGINKTESDYYYIFKILKEKKDILLDIFYKNINPEEQNKINYKLYKIKTNLIKKIIKENQDITTSNYNDSNKGINKSYKIPIRYFNDIDIIDDNLNNIELDNLNKKSIIQNNKIFY